MKTAQKHVLQWHITHICNLRCKHCYQEEYNNHIAKADFYSALEKYDKFIEAQGYEAQINLTGGEPLLHPDFFEFATEVKKRKYRLGILTNGTLIDDAVAERISRLHPVFVQISLDGTKKTHDSIRGEGTFEKALLAIDYLKKYGVKVLVSFTAQKQNYRDYPKLVKICRRHKVDKIWWDRVATYSVDETKSMALSTEDFKWMVKTCNRLKKMYFLHKNFVSNQRALQFIGTNDCGYRCSAGRNLLVFLADGSIMPCRRLPFIVGNIKYDEIDNIVKNDEIMKKLRRVNIPNKCNNCKEYYRCHGGAKCITYAQTADLFIHDVNCFL